MRKFDNEKEEIKYEVELLHKDPIAPNTNLEDYLKWAIAKFRNEKEVELRRLIRLEKNANKNYGSQLQIRNLEAIKTLEDHFDEIIKKKVDHYEHMQRMTVKKMPVSIARTKTNQIASV